MFNKLPGFQRSPAGLERSLLRHTPRIFLWGSLLLAVPSALFRAIALLAPELIDERLLSTVDIMVASLVVLHWTVVFTVAIAAFIVMVMKGPAYVADAYPLSDAERPGRPPVR